MSKTLFILSAELFDSILDYLATGDLCNLRLTCQKLNPIMVPRLFDTIRISKPDIIISMPEAASSSTSVLDVTPYVRHLVMETLFWEGRRFQMLSAGNNRNYAPPVYYSERVTKKTEMVSVENYLVSFVRRLRNLQSLRWKLQTNKYVAKVMEVFSTLPNLKEVSIHIKLLSLIPMDIPLANLSAFKNLSLLHVHYAHAKPDQLARFLKYNVSPVVAASPGLKSLHVIACGTTSRFANLVEDSLVQAVSELWVQESSTHVLIEDLKFSGVPLNFDKASRPVFQNLRHLTILHTKYDDISYTMAKVAWENIWDTLYDIGTNHGVWLKTLHTEATQPLRGLRALFRYLESHPGLNALSLRKLAVDEKFVGLQSVTPALISELDDEEFISSTSANGFWLEIVPHFGHCLSELHVDSRMAGPWCYGPSSSQCLRQCTHLKRLRISIGTVDGIWAAEKAATANITISNEASVSKSSSECDSLSRVLMSSFPPIEWGSVQSTPILLALDMAEMPLLEAVVIKLLFEEENDADFWAQRTPSHPRKSGYPARKRTRQTVQRFIPWEGYPHIISGPGSIIYYTDNL